MCERPPIRGERAKRFAATSVARDTHETVQHGHYCITRGDRRIARDHESERTRFGLISFSRGCRPGSVHLLQCCWQMRNGPREHRVRPQCWWFRRLVAKFRGRAARRHPVETISGHIGRDRSRNERAGDRILANAYGRVRGIGAARLDRRRAWAGNRRDQSGAGWPRGACRTAGAQSALRLRRGPDDYRAHGRHRLFPDLSSHIPGLGCPPGSVAYRFDPDPPDRYPFRPRLWPARARCTDTTAARAAFQSLDGRGLLIFAACLFLFQVANASILPLAGEQLASRGGTPRCVRRVGIDHRTSGRRRAGCPVGGASGADLGPPAVASDWARRLDDSSAVIRCDRQSGVVRLHSTARRVSQALLWGCSRR